MRTPRGQENTSFISVILNKRYAKREPHSERAAAIALLITGCPRIPVRRAIRAASPSGLHGTYSGCSLGYNSNIARKTIMPGLIYKLAANYS